MTVFFSFVRNRLQRFYCACVGIVLLLKTETHGRLHGLATLVVVLLSLWLRVSGTELALVVIALALVWIAEALNTAVERLADALMPEEHPLVGQAKDVAAGAVLVAVIAAGVIGLLVFAPPLYDIVLVFMAGGS